MDKTTSVAMIAMKYVKAADELKNFDLVRTIRLKDVNKTSSLTELILAQHDRLNEYIDSILKGRTKYSPGTNKDIDEAIDLTV